MPGLLRGVARTAVVAGTATAVSNRVSRRQARRWSAQEGTSYGYGHSRVGYAEPPPQEQPMQEPMPQQDDTVERLRELASLRDDGILTEEEFAAEKRKLLG
jgi:putative oligomerization/nucleic acid binding protein